MSKGENVLLSMQGTLHSLKKIVSQLNTEWCSLEDGSEHKEAAEAAITEVHRPLQRLASAEWELGKAEDVWRVARDRRSDAILEANIALGEARRAVERAGS